LVCPASIGSAANGHIDPRWYRKLLAAPRILARMDNDAAGDRAAAAIEALSGAVRRVQVPTGKDINDFYLDAGEDALWDWLAASLKP
jgi:DNA primase